MQYWLMKTEPDTYSWEDLVRDGSTWWDGVRNYQARNNMKLMKKGDQVLFYHSGSERQILGIAQISQEWKQDPTTDDDRWVVVELVPVKPLKQPITLATIKANPQLDKIQLVTHSRLSVQELPKKAFEEIQNM